MNQDRALPISENGPRRIINQVALDLAQATDENLDGAIDRLLGAVSAGDGADRGYVQLFSDDRQLIECVFEWNRPNVPPRFSGLEHYATSKYAYSVTRILNNMHLHVPDVGSLSPSAIGEIDAMARHGIFSTLLVPLLRGGNVIGLVGFDGVRGSVYWSEDAIDQVRTVGEAIVRALDRRDAANELKAARADAERANDAKNYFLSRMSHELRTPLNAILGFTELMLETSDRSTSDVQALDQIRDAGRHLVALMDDVLDISRIESGRIPVNLAAVDLDRAIERAMDMVCSSGVADNVTIGSGPTGLAGLVVEADETRLEQVLVNVLSNAAKYNVEGGSVAITCSTSDAQTACVAISDTGIGISAENLPRLFEPFDRLGQEDSAVEGTGVGLSLVKTLMETMEGEIDVSSELGVGTTVELRIPLTRQARPEFYMREPQTVPPTSSSGGSGDSRKRLVVAIEDDVSGAAILKRIVEHHEGDSFRSVTKVSDALAHPTTPDLVIVSSAVSDADYEVLTRAASTQALEVCRLSKPYRVKAVTEVLRHSAPLQQTTSHA